MIFCASFVLEVKGARGSGEKPLQGTGKMIQLIFKRTLISLSVYAKIFYHYFVIKNAITVS